MPDEKPAVFYANARTRHGSDLLTKTERIFEAAGFKSLIEPGDLVAVKLSFSEPGNTAYLRPQFVRRVVNKIKERGAKPFLTDSNTIYVSRRGNAVDHLEAAIENGFAYSVVGAPLIIADGLAGKDFVEILIKKKHFEFIKVGSAAYHADAIIGLAHFKGHEATGFGGALKNIGMGFGSRSGKQMMHSDVLPVVDLEKCLACGKCIRWCPAQAISLVQSSKKHATVDPQLCMGCGECTVTCPSGALEIGWKQEENLLQEKIVEFAWGILEEKKEKTGFINFLLDISPDCDCASWSDIPVVNDIGILASKDIVALDQASIDLVNRQEGLPESELGKRVPKNKDKFMPIHNIDWEVQLKYAEQIGLGRRDYNLVKI
jgi:uncharacterized Fe-S center protein